MEISIIGLFQSFLLLAASSVLYIFSKKIKIPYTVLLVIFGSLLVPLAYIDAGSFIKEFHLTPEILFYIFLPILVFESAFNMKIQEVVKNIRSISLLSIVSLLISALSIAALLFYTLPLVGLNIPFIVLFLFGSLISATDPVAVLSLFKEYGAPKRLSLIFEGESLFNDATAVALFFVVLNIASNGFHGASSVLEGSVMFLSMMILGIIFGFFMGIISSKLIGFVRSSDFSAITLGLVSAHITFIAAELISHHMHFGNYHLAISPIIATTICAMVIGNYGRAKISPLAEEFVDKFWGQLAFFANSSVFVLVGLLFVTLPFAFPQFLLPIIISVFVVAFARALSVYPVIYFLNLTKKEENIPLSWQHLLSWGSLRGALAVTMVLLIPLSYKPEGWNYDYTPREFVLALTVGCVYATLFIKATSIGLLIKKLKIDELSPLAKVQKSLTESMVISRTLRRLAAFKERGYLKDDNYLKIKNIYEESLGETNHSLENNKDFSERALKQYFLSEEKYSLKYVYVFNELSESVYKKVLTKLNLQHEALEKGENLDLSKTVDNKDLFEKVIAIFRNIFIKKTEEQKNRENYSYYKAQKIIAEKVLKEISQFKSGFYEKVSLGNLIEEEEKRYVSLIKDLEIKLSTFDLNKKELVQEGDKFILGSLFKKQKRLIEKFEQKKTFDQNINILVEEEISNIYQSFK